MRELKRRRPVVIRYSEAFKIQVVREVEGSDLPVRHFERKYDIRGAGTVAQWVRRYGNGTCGKKILVQKPEEINELERLRDRVKRLERALVDANLDLALEKAYTELACERAGIKDVGEFKKKIDGKPHIKP